MGSPTERAIYTVRYAIATMPVVQRGYNFEQASYNDPTAYNAIKNVEQEQDKDDVRFHQLLNMLFSLCELADFHIEGRVVLKDKRTGKVWR